MSCAVSKVRRKKMIPYQILEGAKVPLRCNLQNIQKTASYQPKPGDLFLLSYPKCGTTWVQYIIYLLANNAENPDDVQALTTSVPFLERDGFSKPEAQTVALKCHLPYDFVPQSQDAKYIYVARNPMDTCVSAYHFFKAMPYCNSIDISFNEYFECFLTGDCPYGDYFEHILPWYLRREDGNVLFLIYEDIKKDHRGAIVKIANFMQLDVAEDSQLCDQILEFSSVDYMKERLGAALNSYASNGPLQVPQLEKTSEAEQKTKLTETSNGVELVRKGNTGGWKSYFSGIQEKRMIFTFLEKTKGTDIYKLWPEIFNDHSTCL